MQDAICITCGTQYPPASDKPVHCPICEDERQYVNSAGQQWTTLAELQQSHTNRFIELEPGLTAIRTEPGFAIGQHAYLIQTPAGNVLWDCISLIDDATVAEIKARGGLAAITISHPHFYTSMIAWSKAFGAAIYLHDANRPWVMHPDPAITFWDGKAQTILPGLTAVCCGGHFPGSSVLHWAGGAAGQGCLFTGDTIYVASDPRYVSFMWSYPNLIPLNASAVQNIVAAVQPYAFDRLYSAWDGKVVAQDAAGAVQRSAERYIAHIQDDSPAD